ncbi:MAG: zinc chelation protein SecC [Moraxellaceae bacterium]|nr:MAG: zinc chelation protein SecC [Moraxellaceae bacterium]
MPPAKIVNAQSACPCGHHSPLATCCLPFIRGVANPPTAEALMRSRYTAHVLLDADYLWDTWNPEQRVRSNKEEIMGWASSCEWRGLQILKTEAGRHDDLDGLVTFIAIFRQNGKLHHHQETSIFKKVLGRWLYVDHKS